MLIGNNVRLVRLLGQGGMGSVWVADHETLHTQVAVKFMITEMGESSEALTRFTREASAAAQSRARTWSRPSTTASPPRASRTS